MASLRDIRNRISSVKNTQQVTRAMKMVAAAKLRKAQEQIFRTRPYAFKLGETITRLLHYIEVDSPVIALGPEGQRFFMERDTVERALLIIVTADRGLAGAFNANIIKLAEQTIEEHFSEHHNRGDLFLMCVGRKGHEYFKRRDFQLIGDYRGVFDKLTYEVPKQIMEEATEGFIEGKWDEVHILYNEFKNTISQNRIVEPLLPIPEERFVTPVMEKETEHEAKPKEGQLPDYIFEPDPRSILQVLIPKFLNFQVGRALLESNAAEQGARMVAMDNATTNADDLLRDLKLKYNRARQDAITKELIEITSGADALG